MGVLIALYGLVFLIFSFIGQIIPTVGIVILMWFGLRNTRIGGAGPMLVYQSLTQLGAVVVSVTIVPLLWGWLIHGILKITGGTGASMRRTMHAVFYSSAARAPAAVPCLDSVGAVWWLVSCVLMVQEGHRCHGFRATAAGARAALL